ncbi:hypothetical protein B0H17DRAFT_1144719 [Mycena rosella]|uniref:Uncharacterized protein n=1 Tax=Mycena rosella TaxID=1033263 RepID=A0AAD7CSS2_MYCRO|nr:hypothetical protein B0H17DRAFT_1144719 [Mycena rosella]
MRLNCIRGVHAPPEKYIDWNRCRNSVIERIAPNTFMLNYNDETRSMLDAQQVQLYCGFNQTIHHWHKNENVTLPSREPPGYNDFLLCVETTDHALGLGWGRADPPSKGNTPLALSQLAPPPFATTASSVSTSHLIISEANLVSSMMAKEVGKLKAQAAKGKLPAMISGAGLDDIDVGDVLANTGRKRNFPSDGFSGSGSNKRRQSSHFPSPGPSRGGSTMPSMLTPLRFSESTHPGFAHPSVPIGNVIRLYSVSTIDSPLVRPSRPKPNASAVTLRSPTAQALDGPSKASGSGRGASVDEGPHIPDADEDELDAEGEADTEGMQVDGSNNSSA